MFFILSFCQFVQSQSASCRCNLWTWSRQVLWKSHKKTVESKRENVKVNGWNFYIFMSFMQYLRMIYLKNSLVRAPLHHLASLIAFFRVFFADISFRDPDDFFCCLVSTQVFISLLAALKQTLKKKTIIKISSRCYRGFSVHSKATLFIWRIIIIYDEIALILYIVDKAHTYQDVWIWNHELRIGSAIIEIYWD